MAVENVPVPQPRHADKAAAPVVGKYVPAGQKLHCNNPLAAAYVPTSQLKQKVEAGLPE